MLRNTQRDDYLLRVIREAGEALRLLRERLAGGTDAPERIRQDASAAVTALLGDEASLVRALDAATAARLVGDAGRMARWAALVELDADAAAAGGHPEVATRQRARAVALRAAARDVWGDAAVDTP